MTATELIEELTYRNYCANRERRPDIGWERWQLVYGTITETMENRYQITRETIANLGDNYVYNSASS